MIDMILRILDTETTGLTKEDEPIQVAFIDIDGQTKDELARFKTNVSIGDRKIPSASKAVHHIQEYELEGKPTLSQIEHIIYSDAVIPVAHNADYDSMMLPKFSSKWLCTKKLARQAFPGLESYANQTLRYSLSLPVLRGTAHDALFDCEVTCALLKKILEEFKGKTLRELYEIQSKSDYILPFGKYKDKDFRGINDRGYLAWLVDNTDIANKELIKKWMRE